MKKKYIVVILIIALLINTFIVIYSKAANSVNWYERYDYNSEEIQNLIKQKNKIQSETNVAPQKDGFDLIIFMGQSNMVGKGGDATKAVQPIDGAGYEMLFNSNNEAQGLKKVSEPFGEGTNNDVGCSMVTAFMNAYYNNTGTPVIGIPAASSGTSVYDYWQDGQTGLENAKSKLQSAINWLNEKGYPIKHKYMIWDQGETDIDKIKYTDSNNKEQTYADALRNTVEGVQRAGVERCFMIRIGAIYLYSGYEEKYKDRYYQYLDMINEQDEICEDYWITLVSTSMATLSKCQNMMTDMVHFNQEALDIVGSEAGKNVAFYADQSRGKTLTTDQENALINYAKNFSYWGTKNNAILYGTLIKSWAYNLQPVPYKDQMKNGTTTRQILYDSTKKILKWKDFEANKETAIGSYGFNGEKSFEQGYYIGLDCSGFISFLYHQVLGAKFDYEYNGTKYTPWTTDQYLQCLEERKFKNAKGEILPTIKLKNASGEKKEVNVFKVIYQKIFKEETISFPDILNDVKLQKGDLIIGYSGNAINHVVMYAGKDANGNDKMIHSTNSPDTLYNMYYDELGKYYTVGEAYFKSNHKYKEVYVLRLNDDIVPKGYVTNSAYKTYSNESYIDWDKVKAGEKLDSVAPQGQVEYVKKKGETEVRITATEDIMQVDGWKLSDDRKLLTKTFTQNAEETVILEDLSANTTKLNIKVEVDNNDLTAQVSYSTTNPTNQDVTVTIKANRQLQTVNGWTLSTDKLSLTKTYTSNTAESVTIKDLSGETVLVNINVTNIDKSAPTVQTNYSTTELTNQDVTVTIKANKQLQAINGWTLLSDNQTLTKTYTSNTTETVTIKDLAGNTATVNVNITNIDKIAPTVQVSYSTTELTNQDVVVTIKANEQLQAINGWSLSTDKLSLTKTYASNTTENVTIKDLAGNTTTVNIKITNIDKTAPTAKVSYSTTELTNQNVAVTIKANEQLQIVSGWTLSSDRHTLTKTYASNTTENVTIKDLAGNTATVTIKIANIDKTAPTAQVSYSTTEVTNQDVVVTIKASEQLQVIDGWTLSSDNLSLTKTYTSNTTENVIIKDLAGNTTTVNIKITNIDKIAPTAQVSYSTTELTNQDVVVTIKANEQLQAINGWSLSTDKLSLTKTYAINTTEDITIKDLAGNIATVNVKITNIDKTAPIAQVSYSTTELTNQDVVVTIKANEKIQKVDGWILSTDNLSLTKTYVANKTENVTIKDLAGNTTTVTINVANINKKQPTFELKQYQIKDNYIVKIKPKKKYRDFIKDIETNQKYTIKEKGKEISGEDLIKTGQTVMTEDGHTYTLVVIGDLSGDGKIGLVELARISKIGAGKEIDIKEIEKMAIDVNADGKINIIDLAAISKYATE